MEGGREGGRGGVGGGGRDWPGLNLSLSLPMLRSVYIGEWKNGNREGYGCMYWAKSGDRYEGEWKNDNICGKGAYVWGDDSRCVGLPPIPVGR